MLQEAIKIPTKVEDLTTEWFDSVVEGKVVEATVIEVIHGTATKVKVELEFAKPEGGTENQMIWIKTGFEAHSKKIGTERVYAGETFFYRNYGGKYETRTPDCLFADSDDDGNSILLLDDLCKLGAHFQEPTVAASPEVIAAGLEAMARYQAATWMDPELWKVDWLRNGGSFDAGNCLDWIYNPEHWAAYQNRPRWQLLHPSLRDRERMLEAHTRLRRDWLRKSPWAMSHGDAHFGQLYTLPGGEARMLDWQCVQVAHHMQDPANLIVSGLAIEDRRRSDRDLVAHYIGKLKEFGVEAPPSVEEAYENLKVYCMHQVSWVMCIVEMQPEENCAAITERASAAAMDYGTLDILLA